MQGAPFDLALVDWNMPVMNGLEMLKQMRAEGFADVKVMMVTTEAENDFIIRALDAGADEYLMKPFDDEALSEKLAMLGLVEALSHGGWSPDPDLDCGRLGGDAKPAALGGVLPIRALKWREPRLTAHRL